MRNKLILFGLLLALVGCSEPVSVHCTSLYTGVEVYSAANVGVSFGATTTTIYARNEGQTVLANFNPSTIMCIATPIAELSK